nr:MAG TPA: hypothetical protein [Caudoviricetes sp.]
MARVLLSGMEYAGMMALTTLLSLGIINLVHRPPIVSPIRLSEVHLLLK